MKSKHYNNYGKKGVTVCFRWKSSFENFIKDMGRRPSTEHSIDRIDNNGNYEPSNCRWATAKEQANNRSNNHMITFNGITQNLTQWAESTGMKVRTLYSRLVVLGWSEEKALTTPVRFRSDFPQSH